MTRLSINYPQYNWDKNVGYGTLGHKEAIEKFGISKYHRKSYKPILKIHDKFNNWLHICNKYVKYTIYRFYINIID